MFIIKNKLFNTALFFMLPIFCISAYADSWTNFINGVKQEALQQGVSAQTLDRAFSNIHEPSRRIKHFSKSQPEHRLTYYQYRNSRVDNYRIAIGRKLYQNNKDLVDEIADKYAVDPCFIMSFWGLETSYGHYMGDFPVIQSLATLAYDSARKEFFRSQLIEALHILDEGHVSLQDFKGEWAGASGQPQFLPLSWREYAVDYDGDGKRDIWKSKADVFASIANYMKKNGWHANEPWAIIVKLPANFDKSLEGKGTSKSVAQWSAMGVRAVNGQALPYQDLQASIIIPNEGPVFLAYPNYRMILKYNNSIYYAGAIGYLADKICHRE